MINPNTFEFYPSIDLKKWITIFENRKMSFLNNGCPQQDALHDFNACVGALGLALYAQNSLTPEFSASKFYFKFRESSEKNKNKLYPFWIEESHSGCSASFAIYMAKKITEDDENSVFQCHHILSVLCGCDYVGCKHPRNLKEVPK